MMRLVRWSLAVAIGLGLSQQPSEAQTVGPVVGQPAPAFALTTTGGKTVRLADFRGKTLVINVWGSWCPPCRLETPDLIAEAKAEAPRGVAFLGVPTTDTPDALRALAAPQRLQSEQQTLRAAVIAALAPVAQSDADLALLARLRGDEAAALGKWADADADYAEALKHVPNDPDALSGQAYAVSHLGDDARVAAIDARVVTEMRDRVRLTRERVGVVRNVFQSFGIVSVCVGPFAERGRFVTAQPREQRQVGIALRDRRERGDHRGTQRLLL